MRLMLTAAAALALSALHLAPPAWASDETDEADAWDVSEPGFTAEAREIGLDTTEGTWMSLDVSPDGQQIVFDLLGDIYLLPIDGGDAVNIASGLAWDAQPQFSPDGAHIAFTSDRAGGDNLWVMNADGSDPRQVSDESFRLVNDPAWTADGQWIAGRKHFTTQRSAGTGEIWMWSIHGGDGVALVERPSEDYQKEQGEPAFSADGQWLYYTRASTPGSFFEYAEDTNREVMHIRRHSLVDGETHRIAGGAGGAVRATPSPDGRWLAFIKRVRSDSRLFVRDLESGTERMLVDAMDQDMQEGWSVRGNYPRMAWLPDNSCLVFWARGGLHRVNLDDGAVRAIPFRVADTRTVYPAVQFDTPTDTSAVHTRMVRWPQLLDDGSAIHESLGWLWRTAPGGEPQRLTRDADGRFEFYPTVSADGRWVYYVAWSDAERGEIRRVSTRGGRSTRIDAPAAHYRDLDVSPDGETLVVRIAGGGNLLSDAGSERPGIWRIDIDSGERTRVTDGNAPHFGPENDRVYFSRRVGSDAARFSAPMELASIDLDGFEDRVVATSQFAREMRMAPDGRSIAFVENFGVHLMLRPPADTALELSPTAGQTPRAEVAPDGGQFVGFTSDGSRVHWALGPNLQSIAVANAFDEEATPDALDLGRTQAVPARDSRLAIVNARIVTMGPDGVIENGTLIIEGDRIAAVGADVQVPEGTPVLDASGQSVMPGMIDAHAHGPYGQDGVIAQQNHNLLGHLALGVTTMHDPSSRAALVFAAAEYAAAGRILSPRLHSTAEIIYGARSPGLVQIDELDDALRNVTRLREQGALSVKNYNQPRRDQRQMVVEAARQAGVLVVAEGGGEFHLDMSMIADGNTGIEHTLPQQAIYDDVLQFWGQTDVGFTPTLVVAYGGVWGEDYFYQESEVWKHPILAQWTPPAELQGRSVRRIMMPLEDYGHVENAVMGRQLMEAGVSVHIGAHGQREGLASHWEMWTFVMGGMTPLQAIETATIAPARYLGLDGDLGSLEVGKLADLVLIDGDVTADIRVSDQITHVVLGGRLLDTMTLDETLTGEHDTQPMYWHGRPESAIR